MLEFAKGTDKTIDMQSGKRIYSVVINGAAKGTFFEKKKTWLGKIKNIEIEYDKIPIDCKELYDLIKKNKFKVLPKVYLNY